MEMDTEEKQEQDESKPNIGSSWFHRDLIAPKMDAFLPAEKKYKPPTDYDSLHRNPAFAGGEKSVFVELVALAKHFHPTVSLFAKKILAGLCRVLVVLS